ncbi:MAG: DUF2063 domain-containing protein [Proteobacteria bacterium]|nr:DUF2063 domain-containing protein [Pseudomonadota bacterium]
MPSAKRSNQPGFMAAQAAFTAYIRNPEEAPLPPDCDARRMGIYRQLFYSNMEGMAARTFPVLKKLLGKEEWHGLFRQFFAGHLCQSPYFRDIPEEFFTWLQTQPVPPERPWQVELAHYEWVELVLEVSEEEPQTQRADSYTDNLTLSPLALPLAYQWPVHRLSPDFMPTEMPVAMTFLLVWRDEVSRVRFMELAPAVARLLQIVATEQSVKASEALDIVVKEFASAVDRAELAVHLETLIDKGIVIPA